MMDSRPKQLMLLIAAAAVALFVYNAVRNPYRAQERAIAQQIANIESDWSLGESRDSDPPPVQAQRVLARDDLWRGLVEPPKPEERALDIDAVLQGIEPTSRTQGTGKDMRARVRTPLNPRGEYYGAGDAIAGTQGIVVKAVARDYVVFSVTHNGKEYTKRVPR